MSYGGGGGGGGGGNVTVFLWFPTVVRLLFDRIRLDGTIVQQQVVLLFSLRALASCSN